jgi:hypothetical protein
MTSTTCFRRREAWFARCSYCRPQPRHPHHQRQGGVQSWVTALTTVGLPTEPIGRATGPVGGQKTYGPLAGGPNRLRDTRRYLRAVFGLPRGLQETQATRRQFAHALRRRSTLRVPAPCHADIPQSHRQVGLRNRAAPRASGTAVRRAARGAIGPTRVSSARYRWGRAVRPQRPPPAGPAAPSIPPAPSPAGSRRRR